MVFNTALNRKEKTDTKLLKSLQYQMQYILIQLCNQNSVFKSLLYSMTQYYINFLNPQRRFSVIRCRCLTWVRFSNPERAAPAEATSSYRCCACSSFPHHIIVKQLDVISIRDGSLVTHWNAKLQQSHANDISGGVHVVHRQRLGLVWESWDV